MSQSINALYDTSWLEPLFPKKNVLDAPTRCCNRYFLSTPNMTGRRFHRTMEWSPPAPGSLKAPLLPPLLNNVQTRERKGYKRGTARNFPPFISIVRYLRSSSHMGHGFCTSCTAPTLSRSSSSSFLWASCSSTTIASDWSGQVSSKVQDCLGKPPLKCLWASKLRHRTSL